MTNQSSSPPPRRMPTCPLCGCQSFQREEGKLDSKWGFSAHRVILLICNQCKYVLQFYQGNTIWDFD
jgi:predicted nucleic-acid-binding Zn-ribbon protein